MTTQEKLLDLLFRRIAPERLLEHIGEFKLHEGQWRHRQYQDWFLSVARTTLDGYSQDEQELLFKQAGQSQERYGSQPFHLIADYGDKVLIRSGGTPVCRFDFVLGWRDISLCLGQDLIVTAWLANHTAQYPFHPVSRFSWPGVIHTDNRILTRLLNDGISENHYHLYGSAAVFPLNWCRLMTWPNLNKENVKWFRERALQPRISRGNQDNSLPIETCVLYAAWIRACLFQRVNGQIRDCGAESRKFHQMLGDGVRKRFLYHKIDTLRYQYGVRFPQPDGSAVCLDYAFTHTLEDDANTDERILCGERRLLYQCFLSCFTGEFSQEEQWIFYLYILLKSHFREEVIQVNRQIGFQNFKNYEDRKYTLWTRPYWNEAYRTAVCAPLRQQPIRSLELRLTPDDTSSGDLRRIYDVDKAVRFYDGQYLPSPRDLDLNLNFNFNFNQDGPEETEKTFYVVHFVKQKELNINKYSMSCRHEKLRRKIRSQAVALIRALGRHPYLCRRVRGIDACSGEIGCGPEVFAPAFRFLRACPVKLFAQSEWNRGEASLALTYHVGEDFLDLASGLRTIDEAIRFLNMRRGDRLGHALALGVDPDLYYETARSGKIGSGRWGDIFQPFGRNRFQDHISELEHCRNNMDAVELYAAYQYSNAVKTAGQKVAHFEITEDYIYFIRQIQLKMRLYIEKVGLSIECNPSSNTLIGAFGEYRNHPILRFYHPRDKENRGARLHVSLNTDDQGVFETSLSFEYILIAATLAAEIETDGNPVYTNREIEDYLRDLQRMGNEQVFTDFTAENKAKPRPTADTVFQE